MNIDALDNVEDVRRFLTEGLWLQHVLAPSVATVRPALEWALEIAAGGAPLPPIGFLSDLGHLAFGLDREAAASRERAVVPGLPPGLARTYEDHVLGKLYADSNFDRAADALRRYQGRDRCRGLAFVWNQYRDRAALAGVHLNPALIKSALETPPQQVLAQGWETLRGQGLMPVLVAHYESLIAATRRLAEVLGPEDVFELERGTALAELGQRVALRQVLQAADQLAAAQPARAARAVTRHHQVPTHILAEDIYPVGGFASLSNHGSTESLLHSQLALMEKAERPDLFDIKYVRGELLYYSRDENQFLRRRRTFLFVLSPDLVQARLKDGDSPWQRIILLLALLLAAVRKLSDWLGTEALRFEFLLLAENGKSPLTQEEDLLRMLLGERIVNGTVQLISLSPDRVGQHYEQQSRRSLCHALVMASTDGPVLRDLPQAVQLQLPGPAPKLTLPGTVLAQDDGEDALGRWSATLETLLRFWL